MQDILKNNTLKLLAKDPLDVKDLVKALKKIKGLEDINKSAVNKFLYAGEKTGQFVKNAETPPVWSLKEGVSVSPPKSASASPKESPEQERPVVKVFKPKETTFILDWSSLGLIPEVVKLASETVHIKAFVDDMDEGKQRPEEIEFISSTEFVDIIDYRTQVALLIPYLVNIEQQDVILVSSDQVCELIIKLHNKMYKSEVKIVKPEDFNK